MIKKFKKYYAYGGLLLNNPYHRHANELSIEEMNKHPLRSDVINFLLDSFNRETLYLEIGVRNPTHNFDKIKADKKYSVDPGIEYKENPVDFKLTSDAFFEKLKNGDVLSDDIKFDVIFIDGLHLAEQVDRDIKNALEHVKDDGYVVLHDCNPPTEWHAREDHEYRLSPAGNNWNGTTWKAFIKWRQNKTLFSCCIDSDWGIGILSKHKNIGDPSLIENNFYEFEVFNSKREEYLNLKSFEVFKSEFNI